MKSIYYHYRHMLTGSEESFSDVIDPVNGSQEKGFTVLSFDEDSLTIRLDGGLCADGVTDVTVEAGRVMYFESLTYNSDEIYGEEYPDVVGETLAIGYGYYATTPMFDTFLMAGVDPDNSICVCRHDANGDPVARVSVFLLTPSDNPVDRKINKYTKRNFLEKYNLWKNNDPAAYIDFYPNEARGIGYEVDGRFDAYVMNRMMQLSLIDASSRAFEEAYEEEIHDHIIEKALQELSFIGFSYGGFGNAFIDLNASFNEKGGVYYFEDHGTSAISNTPFDCGLGLYNVDANNYGRYNMAIAYVDDLSDNDVYNIHREIVLRILGGDDVQEYLDSLGHPIVVYYAKAHYDMLAPTFGQISGRKATICVDYLEKGHNARSESRDVNETAFFIEREGYFRLYGDMGLPDYPRRGDLVKIEAIGEDYVDLRLPFFFDEYGIASHFHETDAPHRVYLGKPFTLTADHTVTVHKYKWHSEITITLTEIE